MVLARVTLARARARENAAKTELDYVQYDFDEAGKNVEDITRLIQTSRREGTVDAYSEALDRAILERDSAREAMKQQPETLRLLLSQAKEEVQRAE